MKIKNSVAAVAATTATAVALSVTSAPAASAQGSMEVVNQVAPIVMQYVPPEVVPLIVAGGVVLAAATQLQGAEGMLGSLGGGEFVPSPAGPTKPTEPANPTTPSPATTYLADLSAASSQWPTGSISVNSTTYTRSLYNRYNVTSSSPYQTMYVLSGKYNRFLATVGLRDNADSAVKLRIQVLVDDRPVFDQVLGYKQANNIDVSVAGGIQLKIVVSKVSGDKSLLFGIGDPRLTK